MTTQNAIYKHYEGTEAQCSGTQVMRELTYSTDMNALRYLTCETGIIHSLMGPFVVTSGWTLRSDTSGNAPYSMFISGRALYDSHDSVHLDYVLNAYNPISNGYDPAFWLNDVYAEGDVFTCGIGSNEIYLGRGVKLSNNTPGDVNIYAGVSGNIILNARAEETLSQNILVIESDPNDSFEYLDRNQTAIDLTGLYLKVQSNSDLGYTYLTRCGALRGNAKTGFTNEIDEPNALAYDFLLRGSSDFSGVFQTVRIKPYMEGETINLTHGSGIGLEIDCTELNPEGSSKIMPLILKGTPRSDPGVSGALWQSGNFLMISDG